ncbi:unknown [Bacteroides sp. CAG:189]|nr:unknown [Bacteroides sp. CAG:189]
MCRIENMCSPITKCPHPKIIPATPLSIDVIMIIIMPRLSTQPTIPIQCLWNRFTGRHTRHFRIETMPTTRIIHMRRNRCYILNYTSFFPSLKLEIICFGVSLITHLCYNTIFRSSTHHQLYFIKRMSHRFFYINMFTQRHSKHSGGKMTMIRSTDTNRINLPLHLIEHHTEISELDRIRKFIYYF